MLRDDLRTLWTTPRPPDTPARVWRDWALLAAALTSLTLEATLRDDVVWRPVAVGFTAWLAVLLLWRRTRPLAMIALGFGAIILLQAATALAAPRAPVGLYSGLIVLLLVYALPRWGSGREIVLGGLVILTGFAVSIATEETPVGEEIAGLGFLLMPAVIGISVRLWMTARERELEQVRSHERERLARELHDTVAHHVSAMVIRAQAGRVVAGADPAGAVEALEGVEEEGARTLEEMRAMVTMLRDRDAGAELSPLAGIADLDRLLRAPGVRLRVNLTLDGDLDALPAPVDAAIYRIVQESLTNTMRHAVDATEVAVHITGDPHRVRVTVRDDGTRPARGRDGYGLAGLRERATLLGGELRAGPDTERGWSVVADLPRRRPTTGAHPRPRR